MSDSNEEPYSTIFASLKHPIRRKILRMLSKKPMSFSEMLEVLGVSSSFLTYHLENLGELLSKMDDGRYKLSSIGEGAIATMTKVEDIPTTMLQQSPQHPETRSRKWSRSLGTIGSKFKMDETKPNRVVKRNVVIALGIACIIMIAGIGVAVGYYTMRISEKDSTITSLTDKTNLANFTVLANNQTITQNAGNYNSWAITANFSGYISVMVWFSTTDNTFVRVIYNATIPTWSEVASAESNYKSVLVPEGAWLYYQYDNQVNVGNGFGYTFPVLVGPKGTTIAEVRLGNTNALENATEQVTIVYYY